MKDKQIVAAAVGVVIVAAVLMRKKGVKVSGMPGYVMKIANPAQQGQPGFSWQYFSDGTSIAPDGSYYKGDVKVWSPNAPGMKATAFEVEAGSEGGSQWF